MTPDPKEDVRVRFAPSPTGPFHIGNARAALFNWLFARHEGGKFLLRIEDTDRERSQKKFEKDILDGIKWLGLEWDEEVIYQSKRLEIYSKYLNELLEKNLAYYCFCTTEELETERQAQLSQGLAPRYSRRCRSIDPSLAKKRIKSEPSVIRFKVPEKMVTFDDLVRDKVKFNAALIGDIIIAKSLKEPLYNFAAAIDDAEMKISHVIRGEDHLSNTPKQILIMESLGFSPPHYAHLPLILGPDRKKLSKRYLDKSLNDYEKEGYLKEAMVNFLTLLGWHPREDREVIGLEDLIKEFSLDRVQKAGAVFNPEKLDWLNSYYIKNKSAGDLIRMLKDFAPKEWFLEKELVEKVVELEKDRMRTLSDFPKLADFFFELGKYPKEKLIWKETPAFKILENLKEAARIIEAVPENRFSKNNLEMQIMPFAEARGRGEVLWPLRVALSGKEVSPGPFEIADVLGKKETLRRIKVAIKELES